MNKLFIDLFQNFVEYNIVVAAVYIVYKIQCIQNKFLAKAVKQVSMYPLLLYRRKWHATVVIPGFVLPRNVFYGLRGRNHEPCTRFKSPRICSSYTCATAAKNLLRGCDGTSPRGVAYVFCTVCTLLKTLCEMYYALYALKL